MRNASNKHTLVTRLLLTCRSELWMIFAAIAVLALVIGEPESVSKSSCMTIGGIAIGAAVTRCRLKLRR